MNILTKWLRTYVPNIPAEVDDYQLAEDLTLRGIAVEGVHSLGEGNGHLFEMDITTNRVDAMNHYGIAREAATIYDLPLGALDGSLASKTGGAPFLVEIEEKKLCGRFTARVLRDVTIMPSASKVADMFRLLGQKQISNAVDASNFVLLDMGHPTHAFDLDKIEGGIVVRLAHKGERLKLLDGTERTLEVDDLVVADERKALALAGVMGGWDSMITPETKNILVEAAWFDPASIRRSSRRHGLHTDASHRFERGADFNAAPVANALVSKLILESGGYVDGELKDKVVQEVAVRTASRLAISLSVKEVQRHLGTTLAPEGITREIVAQYLTSLGCVLEAKSEDLSTVTLPSWRLDLEREIDLIEEVARVYGYNRFANTLPSPGVVLAQPTAAAEAAVRSRLLALGFSESISSTFASNSESDSFFKKFGRTPVELENPLSEWATLLRPTLIPGMLTMLGHNLNRDVFTVRLFEIGAVFSQDVARHVTGGPDNVDESSSLSMGLTGTVAISGLHPPADLPIFELKGVIESLFSLFEHKEATFRSVAPDWFEPGRAATAFIGDRAVGYFGELQRLEQVGRKLRQPVYIAEVDLEFLLAQPLRNVMARELSRYQAVERDFSVLLPDSMQWQTIAVAINGLAIPELTKLAPVEVFRDAKGKAVPAGQYALLLRCVFQSQERTLREDELVGWSAGVVTALTGLGGVLRDGH